MKNINLGDEMFHPCNVDIIKHKVTGIRHYEGFSQYELKAVNNVGACGKIEIIVDARNGKYTFVELINEEHIKYSKGLKDFVEGYYYTTLNEARLAYYESVQLSYWSKVNDAENRLKKAKEEEAKIKGLINTLREEIKELK